MERKVVQIVFDKVNVSTSEIAELVESDRKTVQRILKKLETLELVEWVGSSIRDPKKYYRIKS